jgi:hypothetical protein
MANKKTRKVRAVAKARPKAKPQKNPKAATTQALPKSVVSQNRSEGIRLFKLAGRPTREQFTLVYGKNGPKMTWEQRAAAGVPATKFQAALALNNRGDSGWHGRLSSSIRRRVGRFATSVQPNRPIGSTLVEISCG